MQTCLCRRVSVPARCLDQISTYISRLDQYVQRPACVGESRWRHAVTPGQLCSVVQRQLCSSAVHQSGGGLKRRVSEALAQFSSLLQSQWQYAVRPGNKGSGVVRFMDWPSSGSLQLVLCHPAVLVQYISLDQIAYLYRLDQQCYVIQQQLVQFGYPLCSTGDWHQPHSFSQCETSHFQLSRTPSLRAGGFF